MDCKMREQSAIVLAAGTAITMACMKRIMVMSFAEQWRTKVFLLLNLVLLAILFTSIRSRSDDPQQEGSKNEEVKVEKMKRRKVKCGSNNGFSESGDRYKLYNSKRMSEENVNGTEVVTSIKERQFEVDETEECCNKLSKEELNERAEAFIAMFRQHLALDARQGNINSHWNLKTNRLLTPTPTS